MQYWKNERVVFAPKLELSEVEKKADATFVQCTGVLQALATPPKKKNPKRKKAGGIKGSSGAEIMKELFDESKLNPEFNYMDGEKASVWDEKEGDYKDAKIISYADNMVGTNLPVTAEREAGSEVVGVAAQAFNIPQATDDVPGWISGHVILPPNGIKDAEGVGMCSQVFFVSGCQPKSFEVAIGAPEEHAFNAQTAQRFMLSAGDFFHVPPNNIYRIENHSDDIECKLFWSIIRPMATEGN
jgi:hypothetical protein